MATLHEIAKAADVSPNTVSRALSGTVNYRRVTYVKQAERIRNIAAQLGYKPNSFARAVRRGHFGAVTLLLSTNDYRSTLPATLLAGVHDSLAEKDLHLIVARLPDDELTNDGFVPKVLRECSSDGILINYTDDIPAKMMQLIREFGPAAIWLNAKLEADCVYHDDEGAAYQATNHVIAQGHRRIAYLQAIDWDAHYSTTDRTNGYRRAMQDAGLEPIVMGNLDGRHLTAEELPEHRRNLWRLLKEPFQGQKITAAVAYSNVELFHAVRAAEQLGLEAPTQFSGICFRGQEESDQMLPLPAMVLMTQKLGIAAVNMLNEKLLNPDLKLAPRALAMEFKA